MSADLVGGAIPALFNLNNSFQRHSGEVQNLVSLLTNELEGAYWCGTAADKFRSEWHSEFSPMLRRLSVALQEAGGTVRGRAEALQCAGNV